jgi:hypothetical protein
MKKVAVFTAAMLASGAAFAATAELKDQGTKSQGSCVGVASSAFTGNGAIVSEQAQAGTRAANVAFFKGLDRTGNCGLPAGTRVD